MVDEDPRREGLGAALDERAGHRRPRVGKRLDGGEVVLGQARIVDEVVEERRGEVERRQPLRLDQLERRAGVPVRLADEAAADRVHGQQRVHAHRVVERHDPERAVAVAVAVLDDLREPAGAVGPVRAGHALGPPGRPRRVEHQRRRPLVEVERAGMRVGREQRAEVGVEREVRRGGSVGEAEIQVGLREARRERHEDGAEPLAGPVEGHRLAGRLHDRRHPVAFTHAGRREPARGAARLLQEPRVRETDVAGDDGLRLGIPLGRGEQRERQVHGEAVPAARAIASTIGS